MKRITNAVIGIAAVAALSIGAAGALNAQGKGAPARPPRHTQQMSKPGAEPTAPKSEGAFKGIANKLGTTPEALEQAYATAKQANPKLSRGQFVAANMVAHNLGAKNPAITTQAILDGLKSGKSLGQTLQGLGLTADAAADAEKQAKRDAATAQQHPTAEVSPTPKP
jgi:hypothetical protein